MNQFSSQPAWASQTARRAASDDDAVAQPPLLSVAGLARSFAGVAAVRDVGFDVAPGTVTCLLGPSGCGKSTTLRMIAGTEQPDAGRIAINGRVMSDDSHFLPPEARSIGMVFQDFALFPHLDVAANVGFGLRGAAGPRRGRVADLLERVGLGGYGRKYPHELSGGEQQRVALIRALAPGPCLMLLDEPFSSLDHRLRDGVRDSALDLLRETGTTVVMVTHDPEEAMLMSHRIAIMRGGRLIQEGRPDELYDRPVDHGVAAFFSDLNRVEGRVTHGHVQTVLGRFPAPGLAEGSRAEVVARPQHMLLTSADGPFAEVTRARYLGRESLIELRLDGTLIKARIAGLFLPEPGTRLRLGAIPELSMVFPLDT